MEQRKLEVGDVVQLNETTKNKAFVGAFMAVTEPKEWGAVGFVHIPLTPSTIITAPGRAYYRASWGEMEYVGKATLILNENT